MAIGFGVFSIMLLGVGFIVYSFKRLPMLRSGREHARCHRCIPNRLANPQ